MGAEGGRLVALVMRKAVVRLALGLVVGLLLAVPTANQLAFFLYEIDPRDPLVFGAVLMTLVGTGLIASLVPAMRVTKIDPIAALAAE